MASGAPRGRLPRGGPRPSMPHIQPGMCFLKQNIRPYNNSLEASSVRECISIERGIQVPKSQPDRWWVSTFPDNDVISPYFVEQKSLNGITPRNRDSSESLANESDRARKMLKKFGKVVEKVAGRFS